MQIEIIGYGPWSHGGILTQNMAFDWIDSNSKRILIHYLI